MPFWASKDSMFYNKGLRKHTTLPPDRRLSAGYLKTLKERMQFTLGKWNLMQTGIVFNFCLL